MNPLELFHLLARCLALDFFESQKQSVINAIANNKISIEKFIQIADNHLVLQGLYPNLVRHKLIGYFPDELNQHLKKIYKLNSERNQKILRQIDSVNSLLNAEKIIPLYLKGAGNILDDLYRDPGERILHDIDFLVRENEFLHTAETLIKNGYRTNHQDPLKAISDKHFPALYSEAFPACIEIHKIPVRTPYLKVLPVENIFNRKKIPHSGRNCFVMCDEHKLIHCFIQAQLEQDGHYYARSSLRYLYDSLLLSSRVEPERVFSSFEYYRKETYCYLDILYQTFNINPPAGYNKNLYTRWHSIRYRLNLRYRMMGHFSSILLRMYLSYIKNPVMAIFNKNIRKSLLKKASSRHWYLKHLRWMFGRKSYY